MADPKRTGLPLTSANRRLLIHETIILYVVLLIWAYALPEARQKAPKPSFSLAIVQTKQEFGALRFKTRLFWV